MSRTAKLAGRRWAWSLIAFAVVWPGVGLVRMPVSAADVPPVERIYLVHFSHTDFGFTDLQSVCRELQRRYLDVALDAALASARGPQEMRFHWTAESVVAVDDWWKAATPERRAQFVGAVRAGQIDVTAMPFNATPFLDAAQWRTMLHWLPDDVWAALRPTAALQDDVNGFPRAGATALLDRGIHRLMMGINSDSGGPPFRRPSAFWWKMPDGRRLFVWLNLSYPDGYDFFETAHWRRGPVPAASDTRYRPPRAGDFFRTDEASLRAAHAQCVRRLEQLRKEGYPYDTLALSVTNHWRMDNDPPFLPLPGFVAAWNRLGLKPRLVYTTVSKALEAMENEVGPKAPEYQGEFTDWWANGTASAPREVASSRRAKRLVEAVRSPLWGPTDAAVDRTCDALLKDLCLFDEHTWGSSMSVAAPWSLDAQAQFNEKAAFAFGPMARAEWLLSQRARTRLAGEGAGLLVANPTHAPYRGWVHLIATCLRDDFRSVEGPDGVRIPLEFGKGVRPFTRPQSPSELTPENPGGTFPDDAPNQLARFWVDRIGPGGVTTFRLRKEPAGERTPAGPGPEVTLDATGWPATARWPGMKRPLFREALGDVTAIRVNAFAPRWVLHDMSDSDAPTRDRLRRSAELTRAEPEGRSTLTETAHTRLYTQSLRHPRLRWATRRLELWKEEPRARLTLRFDRISSVEPEILSAGFPLPCEGTLPQLGCGGMPFTPYNDQIPGACRDYFAVDGWADYATPDGHWLWATRDAPLMTLDTPPVWERRTTPPGATHRVSSILFNNFWYTNFVGDEHGVMEFQYDLVWRARLDGAPAAAELAGSLGAEPVVLLNDGTRDDPIVRERLFKP